MENVFESLGAILAPTPPPKNNTMLYKKTSFTSPYGVFFAQELQEGDGIYHIRKRHGTNDLLFIYNSKTNRLAAQSSIVELTPESIGDVAEFSKALYNKDNN